MNNTIIWHCLPNESEEERIARLDKTLHRIFFESKDVCPDKFLLKDCEGRLWCHLCHERMINHGTPRFLESLDAMQLIVESGRFAEVREEFFHWLALEGKAAYECRILLYSNANRVVWYSAKSRSRQEAFYITALLSQGYMVATEGQGEKQ
jgi:hypothetical protein